RTPPARSGRRAARPGERASSAAGRRRGSARESRRRPAASRRRQTNVRDFVSSNPHFLLKRNILLGSGLRFPARVGSLTENSGTGFQSQAPARSALFPL